MSVLAILALGFAQQPAFEVHPDDPLHKVAALTLEPGEQGELTYTVEFEGTLYVRAESKTRGGYVRVKNAQGIPLSPDPPTTLVEVFPDQELHIVVGFSVPSARGSLAVHCVAAPENEWTRRMVRAAREALDEIRVMWREGRIAEALDLVAQVRRELESAPGAELSAEVARVGWELASVASELGDIETALALSEHGIVYRERVLGPEHPGVSAALQNAALVRVDIGDLDGARAMIERALTLLPEDHPDLMGLRGNLAALTRASGDLTGALALEEETHAAFLSTLPPDHRDVHRSRTNLGIAYYALGDLESARRLLSEAVSKGIRTFPPDDVDLLTAKAGLANVRGALGDPAGALALLEDVLATRELHQAPLHPDLLGTKVNVAALRAAVGDDQGALALMEEALTGWEESVSADHPELSLARNNYFAMLWEAGDERARDLQEAVVDSLGQAVPDDHPDLLRTKTNLASMLLDHGDLDGALELQRDVLSIWERTLPEEHPHRLSAMESLAWTRWALGEHARALELLESAHETRSGFLDPANPELLRTKRDLIQMLHTLSDEERVRSLAAELLAGQGERARDLYLAAPHLARAGARVELRGLSETLSILGEEDPLLGEVFATLEHLRHASVASSELALAVARRPEQRKLAHEVAVQRSRIHDLGSSGPASPGDTVAWRTRLQQLLRQRDRLERELRERAFAGAAPSRRITPENLASAMGPDEAAISFFRYERRMPVTEDFGKLAIVDSLLALVVLSDGAVERVELGPAAAIEDTVLRWRRSIGSPVTARGIGVGISGNAADTTLAGEALRNLVLDPVLARIGERTRLYIVADDSLLLVPLDALPWADGVLGDSLVVQNEVSFARLLHGRELSRDPEPELVLVGSIDYGAGQRFPELPGAAAELHSVAERFEMEFEREPRVLSGSEARKPRLAELLPRARFLHVATHGWFAPEDMRANDLRGFSPETLCGLALSGANEGRDESGSVPGILTAGELAFIDLTGCELAVLSACETNVGVRRAGQGIQSLQSALHAAGVRTAITSLWRVDDEKTRSLMELFYAHLWEGGLSKAAALWQAKKTLRERGASVAEWAGWILSGDPE